MSVRMNNNNHKNNNSGAARKPAATLFCHDADFKTLITVPLSAVFHKPAAHLEITRLVQCRNFDPRNPTDSCADGEACKFVHLDASHPQTQVQTIHVNYAYRSLEEVPHPRLAAGEMLSVMAPNNRAPVQLIPSEHVIDTIGVRQLENSTAPLSHCAHFYFNRCCDRGEKCHFVHTLCIDENAEPGQRAPARPGVSRKAVISTSADGSPAAPALARAPATVASKTNNSHRKYNNAFVPPPPRFGAAISSSAREAAGGLGVVPTMCPPSYMSSLSSPVKGSGGSGNDSSNSSNYGHSESPRSATSGSISDYTSHLVIVHAPGSAFRHNPYSLVHTTTQVAVAAVAAL